MESKKRRKSTKRRAKRMKKTESEQIQLTNHEKNMLRKLARSFEQVEKARQEWARKAIIKREDKEDEKYRRKIVK